MKVLAILLVAIAAISAVNGHGRLMKPPNRSSLWRFPEFASQNPPPNYADNELLCGYVHQAENPGTQCGVCGDPISSPTPRPNENGGTYGRGIIAARYSAGQTIDIEVELTAAHLGFMEFRLCTDRNNENQNCFNQHVLQLTSGGTRLPVDRGTGWYATQARLPAGVRCNNCVIQWNYRAGNGWGQCEDGSYGAGCGPQETFRGCADVQIS